ncbi:MAG: TerC family protein [Bacteroidales bacterium]|jgi:predicted tellurium resistance membrane protein TerC|nr:TerC family protein [Bacteroidales bacterium]
MNVFLNPEAWVALLTLVFLEVVLGIDNIVFLSIMSDKAPLNKQSMIRRTGLLLAMAGRVVLLFGVSLLMRLTEPLFTVSSEWFSLTVNGQSIIIFLGGLFMLYKSVTEIHHKFEVRGDGTMEAKRSHSASVTWIIVQIFLLDLIFSIDSVLTAIGMVSFNEFGYAGAMTIMVTAIVVTVLVMMFFATPVSKFVNNHPTVQMLALSFLILIGVALLMEAGHLSHLTVVGNTVGEIPKGYIYFAIFFSLFVEVLNLRLNRKKGDEKKNIKNND